MAADGSVPAGTKLSRFLKTPAGRLLRVVVFLLVLLGCYLLGRSAGDREVKASLDATQDLQGQNQKIVEANSKLLLTVNELQTELKRVQTELSVIKPSDNTYVTGPNDALVVADGHLTIGLIGLPTNQGVKINVNGTPHFATAGDIIKIAPDPSTNCLVEVQSFDMFKATLIASCAAAKP
jgi:hypothetical protein